MWGDAQLAVGEVEEMGSDLVLQSYVARFKVLGLNPAQSLQHSGSI